MLHWRETPEWQLPIYISIVNMRCLWKFAAPSTEDREKNDLFPFTWKDCSSKLFHMIPMRHHRVKLLILVNDPYDLDLCIEDSEHHKHNVKKPYICEKKTLPSERLMHFHPERISMIFPRISQTRFPFNSS